MLLGKMSNSCFRQIVWSTIRKPIASRIPQPASFVFVEEPDFKAIAR